MAWDSLPEDEKQSKMVAGSEDTLPGEVWDSRLGLIFWKKLQQAMPNEIFADDQRIIQLYLFHKLGRLSAKQLKSFTESLLQNHPSAMEAIDRMVSEVKIQIQNRHDDDDDYDDEVEPQSPDDEDDDMSDFDDLDLDDWD
jgi:hypothetical protein